jgi:predicted small metal-binding protein
MKTMICGDVVPGCHTMIRAETEADLLHKVSDHIRSAHRLNVTPKLLEKARGRIRDEAASDAGLQ